MATVRWLGGLALAGCVGCIGNSFSTAPDASTGGPDGPVSGDAPSDTPELPDSKAGDAGVTDAGCVMGTVSFDIETPPGTTTPYCLGAPGTCSSTWLDIRPVGGTSLGIEMPCETTCAACQPIACANLCAAASRLGDGGAQTSWDGTYFASGTCGTTTACVRQACAPAGEYVAKFCGYATTADAGVLGCVGSSSTPTCTELPFTWPPQAGSGPVVGIIGAPAADAGVSCCPATWQLSSCTYPDGGTGQQCHNPALGCASSTMCGQGCDTIVSGRCDAG
jgi:hypothetical protein